MTRRLILCLAIIIGLVQSGIAQAPATAPAFEVASVRPAAPGTRGSWIDLPARGGFSAKNATLKMLITVAYHVEGFQLSGGPGWMDSEGFDIATKAEGNPGREQTRLMLRTLLAERFKLAVRSSTKELPVYELAVGKSGPKLQPAKRDAKEEDGGFRWGGGRINGETVSIADFARILSSTLGRPVLDHTGLSGLYDLKLEFTPERYRPGDNDEKRPSGEPRPDPNGASIFTAIQEQVGLKLEARKGPVEILVIEHVEKPTEN